ncbi:efflux RND transporter periplasmic adaptor subunit, partial [bacterium]
VRGRIENIKVKEGNIVKKNEVIAWISSEDRISLIDSARASYEKAKASGDENALKNAAEEMEIAELAYEKIPVISPINGEVIRRSVEPGQNVFSDTVLFVLSDKLVAVVEVDEADIGKIKLGQKANVKLESFPEDVRIGKVSQIAREGNVVNNVTVYDVTVDIKDIPKEWASEMTANIEFIVSEKRNVLIVPIEAVKERKNKKFVIRVSEDRKFQRVETGITDNRMIEIKDGLYEGDEIILKGSNNNNGREGRRNRNSMLRSFRRMNRR